MLSPNFFNTFFVIPTLNVLLAFYHLFLALKVPGAFGLSIIALTAFIRLLLHPFFDQQIQTSKKMQDLKPHLDKLQDKHKKDPKKLQEEQMRLYREAGINPAAGCLFMIIQMPIFIGLYSTLQLFFSHGSLANVVKEINKVTYLPFLKIQSIDPWFYGINLAVSPQKAGNPFYLLIPLITGVLQYYQVVASAPPKPVVKEEKKDDKKESTSDDFQSAMQTQMKYIFPVMIAWFSYTLPIGLSIYWNIFSLFSIMQYRRIQPSKS